MTAKEMFRQNYFDLISDVDDLIYAKKDGLGNQEIIKFIKYPRLVSMYWESVNPEDDRTLPYKLTFNVNIHLAIIKQMKELGWI